MSDRIALSGFTPHALVPAEAWRTLAHAVRVVLTRRALRDLDPRLLDDLGVSRADALHEAARAPWDLKPPRRRR